MYRKIRFYSVIEAFRQGCMPDNKQIDETLLYVKDTSTVEIDKLSPNGRKLIQDAHDIVETTWLMVQEKNADELFVWHTRDVDVSQMTKDPDEVLPVDKSKTKDDGRTGENFRVGSSKASLRLLLIGRDLARGASEAADSLRLDQEALAHDESAPQDQLITEGGSKVGPTDTPVPEAKVPGMGHTMAQHPKEDLGTGATVKTANGEVKSGQRMYEEGRYGFDPSFNLLLLTMVGYGKVNGNDSEIKKTGLMDKVRGVHNGLSDRITQQHKDTAHNHLNRGSQFLTEEYFPEKRRDQFIYRGKKRQKHNDYQESIKWLLSYVEEYAGHGRMIGGHGKDSHAALTSDEEFRDWFKSLNLYVHKVLLQAGYILEPDCSNRGNQIRNSGHHLYSVKHKKHFNNLFLSVGDWFKAMDPTNKRFGENWVRLTKDLLFDSEGSLKFKPESWSDIRKVFVPTLVDKHPWGCVEYTDDAIDFVVENLTLSGRNLFFNIVSIEAHNFIKFSPYSAIPDEHHHEFTLTFGQVHADMRDVTFYFR
ncbi:hypothetical protein PILCRDRAFT_14356 [Piloderma croceum F 1598]|uniref:HAM1-like N-terminal domain-containing protein n=1 Tax=Piloderma croceum (strain F 1598) TaxID=765440 RepID=A0A0C3EPX2_PILCF|nr:hypothetical protein PILCRDRAFT_14356 [Piloderma croceum F 1598]